MCRFVELDSVWLKTFIATQSFMLLAKQSSDNYQKNGYIRKYTNFEKKKKQDNA